MVSNAKELATTVPVTSMISEGTKDHNMSEPIAKDPVQSKKGSLDDN